MNQELSDVQAGFRKGKATRGQIAKVCWIIEKKKKKNSRKISTSALLTVRKPLCGSQQTVENSERDGNNRPPYLHSGNLYLGQEATVRTRHGTMDWFQIGKGVH